MRGMRRVFNAVLISTKNDAGVISFILNTMLFICCKNIMLLNFCQEKLYKNMNYFVTISY